MGEKYVSKLNDGILIKFKAEKIQADLLEEYCDENGFNRSAILRRMLIDFLKDKGIY